jgi:hypothetical protein
MRSFSLSLSLVLSLSACVPTFAEDPSLVASERVLAVRAEPSEAAPGDTVTLTALDADAAGLVPSPSLDWAPCLMRLPLSEPGPVARACIAGDADALGDPATGPTASIAISNDACRLFGPDPPPTGAGRPVDPDSTGGFVQPVRIALTDGTVALAFVRLHCGVAGATREQASELRRRYHANTHPTFVVTLVHGDGSFQDVVDRVPVDVTAGETLTLRATWPECPDETACGGAERYARFDRDRGVVVARESLRASWLGTLGAYAEPRTGRATDDETTWTENTWVAPEAPTAGSLFVVVRDDREGVSWIVVPINVVAR